MHNKIRGALLAATLAVLAAASYAQGQQIAMQFDLPAQPLADSLRAVSKMTDTNILMNLDLIGDRKAPAIKEKTTIEGVLRRLLDGTGLTSRFVDEKTVVVAEVGHEGADRESPGRQMTDVGTGADPRMAQALLAEGSKEDERQGRPTSTEGGGLEEVVVTAQKREERLQDVPVSIAVVGADDIEKRQLVNAEDYLRGIPGVNQTTDLTGQSIIIRGIETQPYFQNYGAGTTVATYFGETETTSSGGVAGGTAVDIKLVDIDRVEVLRGPQGTAFGNGSLGGAVRTIPVAPKLGRFDGSVAVGYSNTANYGDNNSAVEAVLNIPLGERIAIRAVGYRFSDSGYYTNIAGSDPTTQTIAAGYGAANLAANGRGIGNSNVTGGRLRALFQATDKLNLTLTYLRQNTQVDGFAQATRPGYAQTLLQVGPETVRDARFWGGTGTYVDLADAGMNYDLGWADLVATYSYVKGETTIELPDSINPAIFGEAFAGSALVGGPQITSSGEVRLVTRLSGRWNGIVGLYGERQNGTYQENDFWDGTPAANPFNYPPLTPEWDYFHDKRHLEQEAAFGELNWSPLAKWTVTAGVRAYHYKRSSNFFQDGFFTSGPLLENRAVKASGTTKRGNLSFKPTEDTLLYASYSEGFRLGRPQSGVPASICDKNADGLIDGTDISVVSTYETKPDTLRSFEVGTKTSLLDRRLQIDADVFHIKWRGLPIYAVGLNSNPNILCSQYTANVGVAASDGIEFQSAVKLAKALRLDVGFAYIHARLTEAAQGLSAPAGTQLPGSPKVNANLGLEYAFGLGGYQSSVRADAHYIGTHYGNFNDAPNLKAGDYTKVDLSGQVMINGQLSINPYIHNLFNADDYTFRGFYSGQGQDYGWRLQPRTVGLRVDYKF